MAIDCLCRWNKFGQLVLCSSDSDLTSNNCPSIHEDHPNDGNQID
ncbi:hypothetical protein RB4614 [Rhodopirellula baltica SH 1]|uniref:Uncharacterized protein n=1 Tax=Rhodopirellula baltica (strain DSM 10527 / NCIMB 13988 / SH1) TaxID=243090 RepID=Q7USA7_RHOBA|nr:hypothetical protein RB4614 [Rhodopirellula baltica SH 1]